MSSSNTIAPNGRPAPHGPRGFSLNIVLGLSALLAAAIAAMLATSLASVKNGGALLKRREAFYMCDGTGRSIGKLASDFLSSVNPGDYATPAALNTALHNAVETAGGGAGLPDVLDPGWALVGADFSVTGKAGSVSPIPNGPFRGMNARQDVVSIDFKAQKAATGFRCGQHQSMTVGQIFLFQFFAFAAGDWSLVQAAPITIKGRVHTNGEFCVGTSSFSPIAIEALTSASKIHHADHCAFFSPPPSSDADFLRNGGSSLAVAADRASLPSGCDHDFTSGSCSGYSNWKEYAENTFALVRDSAHGVPALKVPFASAPLMQPGAKNNGTTGLSNTGLFRFFIDPPVSGEDSGTSAERLSYQADIRIIDGVWYKEDGGTWPGTPIWSDHPGNYTLSNTVPNAEEYTLAGAKAVGQEDLFGVGDRPHFYSYYETESSTGTKPHFVVDGDLNGVISYGTLAFTGTRFVPGFWNENWIPGNPNNYAVGRDPNPPTTGPATKRRGKFCAWSTDGNTKTSGLSAGGQIQNALTASCIQCVNAQNDDGDCSDTNEQALSVGSGAKVLVATQGGFHDWRIYSNSTSGGTPAKEKQARILPVNFDIGQFAAALKDTSPGELGTHFTPSSFNGIVWITYTWPKQLDGLGTTVPLTAGNGLWPAVESIADTDQDPTQAQTHLDSGAGRDAYTTSALPYPLCSQSEGYSSSLPRRKGFAGTQSDGSSANGFEPAFTIPNCDSTLSNTTRPNALRLINGSNFAPSYPGDDFPNGLTIGTNLPIYILGDYNKSSEDGAPAGDPDWVSSLVAGDAVTLLSNAWRDQQSPWGPGFPGPFGRVATSTHYQTAVFTGANSQMGATTQIHEGIHNFLRYMEDWGGATSSVHGSIVFGFYSVFQHQPFSYFGTGGAYQAPHPRDYVFDTHFELPTNQPPGSPHFTVTAVRSWKRF